MTAARFSRRVLAIRPNATFRPRKTQIRLSSTVKAPLRGNSSSSWSVARIALFGLATGVSAFAVGFGIKSANSTLEYSREAKFAAPKYASMKEMERALDEIRSVTSEDTITTDEEELKRHGYSEWDTYNNPETLPVAVAYPKSTEEVSQIAKICNKYRIPMIPYSGGSSLGGNFSAPHGGISIDFAHMDRILHLHENDMDIVVQPSVPWMKLNTQLESSGLFFPIDPGPTAQIGGMVGTNCSGTNAVRYGTMKDWVLNLTVVLADGTIIKTKNRPRKSAAGYNLNGLFIGSEGTLGLVTEITLKLAVIPKEFSVAVVTFPTIQDAAATASSIMRSGVPIAALELVDEAFMTAVNRSKCTAPRIWKEVPTLFLKFSGTKATVMDNIREVQGIAKAHRTMTFEFAKDQKEQDLLWSARKQALWSMLATLKEGTEVWTTDVAVPLSRLADIIELSKKESDDLGIPASIVGHLGDGNFHQAIIVDKNNPVQFAAIEKCVQSMVDRALEMDGTCTGEHGIGLGKKDALFQELGLDTVGVMKSIKQALDPHWLLNPGKIFDTPS